MPGSSPSRPAERSPPRGSSRAPTSRSATWASEAMPDDAAPGFLGSFKQAQGAIHGRPERERGWFDQKAAALRPVGPVHPGLRPRDQGPGPQALRRRHRAAVAQPGGHRRPHRPGGLRPPGLRAGQDDDEPQPPGLRQHARGALQRPGLLPRLRGHARQGRRHGHRRGDVRDRADPRGRDLALRVAGGGPAGHPPALPAASAGTRSAARPWTPPARPSSAAPTAARSATPPKRRMRPRTPPT